jgi:hypothetical protein
VRYLTAHSVCVHVMGVCVRCLFEFNFGHRFSRTVHASRDARFEFYNFFSKPWSAVPKFVTQHKI